MEIRLERRDRRGSAAPLSATASMLAGAASAPVGVASVLAVGASSLTEIASSLTCDAAQSERLRVVREDDAPREGEPTRSEADPSEGER